MSKKTRKPRVTDDGTPPAQGVGGPTIAPTSEPSPPAVAPQAHAGAGDSAAREAGAIPAPRAPIKNPPQIVAVERATRDPARIFLRREPPAHLVGTFKADPALVVDDVLASLSGITGPEADEGRWRVATVRSRTATRQVVVLVPVDPKAAEREAR